MPQETKEHESKMIPLYKPTLSRPDMERVLFSMADEKIGPGPKKAEFEEALCSALGFNGARALRTLKGALSLALGELDIPAGAKVLISPLSSPFLLLRLKELGYCPIFGDVDESTGTLLKESAPEWDAVIHTIPPGSVFNSQAWDPSDTPKQIFDITNLIGTSQLPTINSVAIVSLEEDSPISSALGWAVLSTQPWKNESDMDEALSDLNCALGISQLDALEMRSDKCNEIISLFKKSLLRTQNHVLGSPSLEKVNSANAFCVIMAHKNDEALKYLKKKSITCQRAFIGSAASRIDSLDTLFPHASYLFQRTFRFPLFYYMKKDEIETVSKALSILP